MYYWTAYSDDGAYENKSEKDFITPREAYDNMRDAVLDKMKWNTEYDEDFYDTNKIIYEVVFSPTKITHQSYSGLYTYEIKRR